MLLILVLSFSSLEAQYKFSQTTARTDSRVFSNTGNPSRIWAENNLGVSTLSYGFGIESSGYGSIFCDYDNPTANRFMTFSKLTADNNLPYLLTCIGSERSSRMSYSSQPSYGHIKNTIFNTRNSPTNTVVKGLLIEASDPSTVPDLNFYEGSGVYMDEDIMTIWSPADNNYVLLGIYEEDNHQCVAEILEDGTYFKKSDASLKENILRLQNPLNKIRQVQGYQYNFIQSQADIDKGVTPRSSYGFLAQEIETVLPYAIHNSNNIKYVDYDGIMPLLLEAIKSLDSINTSNMALLVQTNNELNAYKNELNVLKSNVQNISSNITNSSEAVVGERAQLFQNNPNPFNTQTEISYYVPTNSVDSKIVIFDMTGALIKQVPISKLGKGSVILPASNLNAGMYYYTLMINNSEVDTKKMILLR